MSSIIEGQYSIVVIPQKAWENIIKTLDELKDKVERLMAQKEVVFQSVCPKSVTSGMRCKIRQIF